MKAFITILKQESHDHCFKLNKCVLLTAQQQMFIVIEQQVMMFTSGN